MASLFKKEKQQLNVFLCEGRILNTYSNNYYFNIKPLSLMLRVLELEVL